MKSRDLLVAGVLLVGCGSGAGADEPSVPAACLEALDLADEAFGLAADGFGAAADGFFAASEFDAAGVRRATRDMDAAVDEVAELAPDWHAARDECREAADD